MHDAIAVFGHFHEEWLQRPGDGYRWEGNAPKFEFLGIFRPVGWPSPSAIRSVAAVTKYQGDIERVYVCASGLEPVLKRAVRLDLTETLILLYSLVTYSKQFLPLELFPC